MKIEEVKKMISMNADTLNHIQSTGGQSLLGRLYGIFKVSHPLFATVHVVFMQNCAQTRNTKVLEFDLKGSSVGR